jgi:hypothetical protein
MSFYFLDGTVSFFCTHPIIQLDESIGVEFKSEEGMRIELKWTWPDAIHPNAPFSHKSNQNLLKRIIDVIKTKLQNCQNICSSFFGIFQSGKFKIA